MTGDNNWQEAEQDHELRKDENVKISLRGKGMIETTETLIKDDRTLDEMRNGVPDNRITTSVSETPVFLHPFTTRTEVRRSDEELKI